MKPNFFVSTKTFLLITACLSIIAVSHRANAQTLTGATGPGLNLTGTLTYDLDWYSSEFLNEYEKQITVSYSNFSSTDKIVVTGNSASTQVQYWQVKDNLNQTWKDVTNSSAVGTSANLCFAPGAGSGSVTFSFRRMGSGGSGSFDNDITIAVADQWCDTRTGTGKEIILNTTVIVDEYVYNYGSQATLSNYSDASAWSPQRSTTRSSDVLVFDRGTTAVTVQMDITSETIKKIVLMRDADVLIDDRNATRTLTLSGTNGGMVTDATSTLTINGSDTVKFNLSSGAEADINGDLIIKSPTNTSRVCRLSFTGGGSIYFGGDVDVQTRTSLRVEQNAENTIFFDGTSQEFKGAGDVYFNYLTNVTVGVSGKTATPNTNLTLRRGLPILGVLTLRNYATLTNTTVPASSSATDWQAWMPDLQIKNDGSHRGRIATLGTNASISGASYFEMYSNGIRTYRTIGFPMDNVHLSQITDDLIISGVFTGTNQDSMDRSCGYCKASSYLWDETNSTWDSLNGSNTPTKIGSGQGLLLFFRGLAGNGLGNPSAAANAGNIDYKGVFTTGTKTATLVKAGSGTFAGYNLVGNPYPCHIDFTKLTRTNVQDKFQILDPTTKSYNVWNNTTGTVSKTGSTLFRNDANANIIEIGASFFAIADQNNGTIEFNEDDKVTTEPAATAFRTEQTPIPCNQLHGSIQFVTDTIEFMDMHILEWNASYDGVSSNLDKYDADKFYGGYLAIGTVTPENNWLTMDYRPASGETTQIIPMSIRTMQKTAYKMTFQTCEDNSEYFVSVRDKQSDSLIEVGAETQYIFETKNGDKFGNDRFEVVIESKTNAIDALKSDFQITAYPNPIEQNSFRLLGLKDKQINEVIVSDVYGKQYAARFDNGLVTLGKSLNTGTYFVKVNSNQGVAHTKIIVQ